MIKEIERAQTALLVLDQKIPEWLINMIFLGKFDTAIRSGIKCMFSVIG